LKVPHPDNKFLAFYGTCFIAVLKQPAIGHYPELDTSSRRDPILLYNVKQQNAYFLIILFYFSLKSVQFVG